MTLMDLSTLCVAAAVTLAVWVGLAYVLVWAVTQS